jgi:hypothetical protein
MGLTLSSQASGGAVALDNYRRARLLDETWPADFDLQHGNAASEAARSLAADVADVNDLVHRGPALEPRQALCDKFAFALPKLVVTCASFGLHVICKARSLNESRAGPLITPNASRNTTRAVSSDFRWTTRGCSRRFAVLDKRHETYVCNRQHASGPHPARVGFTVIIVFCYTVIRGVLS